MAGIFAYIIFECISLNKNAFRLKFHCNLLIGIQVAMCQHWLAPNMRHARALAMLSQVTDECMRHLGEMR